VVKKAVQEEIPFEDALSELESLVETMEKGELSLEESLASFERGVALTRLCQQALRAAEQKIEILSANSSEAELESFQGD